MGKVILKDATVVVNGTDLSRRASSATVNLPDDEVEVSTFQGGNYKEFDKGLSDASIDVTFYVDYDVGNVDDVLWPLKQSNNAFKMYVAPHAGAISQTNPAYGLNAKMYNYSPLTGQIGQASTTDVTFRNSNAFFTQGVVKCKTPTELSNFLAST